VFLVLTKVSIPLITSDESEKRGDLLVVKMEKY